MMDEVVKKQKNEPQASSSAQWTTGSGDVECDSCTGRKRKAVRSCLVCLTSYCKDHLQPHFQSPAFKKHKLVKSVAGFKKEICFQHNKLMEIYCRTDQTLICCMCMMENHKGHNSVSAKEERSRKQNDLKEEQIKSQQRIQEKQKKMQDLKHTVDIIKRRSQAAVDDSERIFTDLISSMEKKRSEVTELIRAQEKAELSRTERFLNQLEQEIADLQRRLTELEQLSHTHDHVHFLQSFPSLRVSPGCDDSPSFTLHQHLSFDGVKKPLKDLKQRVEKICAEEFNKIRPQAAAAPWILPPELKINNLQLAALQRNLSSKPKSRQEFLQCRCSLTLDPNTTNPHLVLSEMNRAVSYNMIQQRYSKRPDRFMTWPQVLCKEVLCGRRYWEVEWSGLVDVVVSYKDISWKTNGKEFSFGRNSQSWSLECLSTSLSFYHNNIETKLPAPAASRIGVYVDYSAGTLSFYSVSDTMELLHTVHTTFTQPLYAGFTLWNHNSTVWLM